MATSKILNARIQQKNAPTADWKKAINFIPLAGEIIIYTDLNRFKIGDGLTKINDLKFVDETVVTQATFDNGKFIFKNSEGAEQFNVSLPIYKGEEL